MNNIVDICVYLPEEDVDTWLPTKAEDLGNGLYKLLSENYKPRDPWEFPPGTIVRGIKKDLYSGSVINTRLVAVKAD